MKNVTTKPAKASVAAKQYGYAEVVEYLDTHWNDTFKDATLSNIQKLDKALGSIAKKTKTIFVHGTNGKSLTSYFTAKLLAEEGLNVGTYFSPHILTYNERISSNGQAISNKTFSELASEVLNSATTLDLTIHSQDLLFMTALLHFNQNKMNAVVIEIDQLTNTHPAFICKPTVSAITRITDFETTERGNALLEKTIKTILSNIDKESQIVSGDQNKFNLHIMEQCTQSHGATWAMPIRKLAPLAYPFEQLHGRCAALAERIGYLFVNQQTKKTSTKTSLLAKMKGQRGRPTLEAKRQAELNPKRTLEQFWKEVSPNIAGRFQLLEKEKPTILLDTASNLDAFENLLLGIRLLHYRRPLKGLVLILGCNKADLQFSEMLKLLRYFFKKTSGQVVICPAVPKPGEVGNESWDVEKITNDIKSMKIKARAAHSFKEAFEYAQKAVDERNGLVVVSGSNALVSNYWRYKGIKKF